MRLFIDHLAYVLRFIKPIETGGPLPNHPLDWPSATRLENTPGPPLTAEG